uniref:Uncharacterized protein n=1 Tax=Physcomitrium patens TaxID=3218 RepID=A0A2K1JL05_PHYPA|nr:hypothetical protein PHYPA_017052 [Physcomitrium patens]
MFPPSGPHTSNLPLGRVPMSATCRADIRAAAMRLSLKRAGSGGHFIHPNAPSNNHSYIIHPIIEFVVTSMGKRGVATSIK